MATARRTAVRLSDGRELIYFDESAGSDRSAPDRRDLAPSAVTATLRHDELTDEWVVIASHRQARTHLPETASCPLCPTGAGHRTEIPAADYDVVVFENRFPSLTQQGGTGRSEVVCFSADHDASFASLPSSRVRTIVDAWADRTAALAAMPSVEQVFVFENRGREIGVTLTHPHGQIYAYPFVTPRTRRTAEVAARHRARTGRNLFADVLDRERAGPRVVAANEHWTAFVPAAARWPVEVHLYPHRRVLDLPGLDAAQRDAFGPLYLDLLRRCDALFGVPLPYVAGWHQAPVREQRDEAYLRLELFSTRRAPDRLKYLAGSESAMDVFVNDVVPEDMARRLREVA